MKKAFLFTCVTILVISCSPVTPEAKLKAEDVCKAIEIYKEEDPTSLLQMYDAVALIQLEEEKYGEVSKEELMMALEKICPGAGQKIQDLNIDL